MRRVSHWTATGDVEIAYRAKALEQVARHLQMFKVEVKLNAAEELIARHAR